MTPHSVTRVQTSTDLALHALHQWCIKLCSLHSTACTYVCMLVYTDELEVVALLLLSTLCYMFIITKALVPAYARIIPATLA